jgi:hypothetical protein
VAWLPDGESGLMKLVEQLPTGPVSVSPTYRRILKRQKRRMERRMAKLRPESPSYGRYSGWSD